MNWIYSMFWREKSERNSLTPHSLAPMPKYVFHNYAIIKRDHEDDEEPNKTIWGVLPFTNFPFVFPYREYPP